MTTNDVFDILADAIAEKVAARLKVDRPVKKLLDAREAAVYIGRSVGAVQHLVARGDIPAVRAGRRIHIAVDDLEKWIERNKT